MLITKVKELKEIEKFFNGKTYIFKCFGCKEVYFPEEEITGLINEKKDKILGVARVDYLCRKDFSKLYIEKNISYIEKADFIFVFSCGVGVQTVSKLIENKIVIPGCDTYYLNGFQGLNVLECDCQQCGECYLNYTGGICPITSCSKGLLNGACGGSKNGKCEVNSEMDCGWILIYEKLKKIGKLDVIKKYIKPRNYELYEKF